MNPKHTQKTSVLLLFVPAAARLLLLPVAAHHHVRDQPPPCQHQHQHHHQLGQDFPQPQVPHLSLAPQGVHQGVVLGVVQQVNVVAGVQGPADHENYQEGAIGQQTCHCQTKKRVIT